MRLQPPRPSISQCGSFRVRAMARSPCRVTSTPGPPDTEAAILLLVQLLVARSFDSNSGSHGPSADTVCWVPAPQQQRRRRGNRSRRPSANVRWRRQGLGSNHPGRLSNLGSLLRADETETSRKRVAELPAVPATAANRIPNSINHTKGAPMPDSELHLETRHPFAAELAGRKIIAIADVSAAGGRSDQVAVRARDTIERNDECVKVVSLGQDLTLTVSVAVPTAPPQSTAVAARIRLRGWSDIRYVAFGYNVDGTFVHIKLTNLPQGQWLPMSLDRTGLAFKIQNQWHPPALDRISEARIFVRTGTPCPGATVEIEHVAVWTEDVSEGRSARTVRNDRLLELLGSYYDSKYPEMERITAALDEGTEFPILPDRTVPWPSTASTPVGVMENATYRYIWHSLQVFAAYALQGVRGSTTSRVEAALREALAWIERSYRVADPDLTFAWYDHGTAERLLSLVAIRQAADAMIDRRTASVLDEVIDNHARLLQSEAFYAANQKTRFHNHSIFQDVALIAAAASSSSPAAGHWQSVALNRIDEQFHELIIHEREFAVFAENSSGYHDGIALLVQLAGEFEEVATGSSRHLATAASMRRFSELVRSHYGRVAAFGDTYRMPNPVGDSFSTPRALPSGLTLLERSGYAVIRGTDDDDSFQVTIIGSSKSPTHKHADHLSVSLIFAGVEWLVDPSFYSHSYAADIPAYLRGPWAHNMVVLEDAECSIEAGLTILAAHAEGGACAVRGSTAAFSGATVTRTLSAKTDALDISVADSVTGNAGRAYVNLHFGDGVEVEVNECEVVLSHRASPRSVVLRLPSTPELFYGWNGDPQRSSVVATAFETRIDSVTARIALPPGGARWSLVANAA